MFLFCGLVSKNHMLLNLPGILIPQNANHLLPGLFLCQLESLSSDSKMRGPTERALWFEDHCLPFLPLTCHSLVPHPQAPFLTAKLKVYLGSTDCQSLSKERDIVERAEETVLCSQLTLLLFYITQTVFLVPFLQMDLF